MRPLCFTPLLAAAFLSLTAPAVRAAPLFELTLQPYSVCWTSGFNVGQCGDVSWLDDGSAEVDADKVLAQAAIDTTVLPSQILSLAEPTPWPPTGSELINLFSSAVGDISPTIPVFVHQVTTPGNLEYASRGWLGQGGIEITRQGLDIGNLVHQIGHNLGLNHAAGWPNNGDLTIMGTSCAGVTRVDDIYPDGLGFCTIDAAQVSTIQASALLQPIPEPTTALLVTAGLLGLAVCRRGRPPREAARR